MSTNFYRKSLKIGPPGVYRILPPYPYHRSFAFYTIFLLLVTAYSTDAKALLETEKHPAISDTRHFTPFHYPSKETRNRPQFSFGRYTNHEDNLNLLNDLKRFRNSKPLTNLRVMWNQQILFIIYLRLNFIHKPQ